MASNCREQAWPNEADRSIENVDMNCMDTSTGSEASTASSQSRVAMDLRRKEQWQWSRAQWSSAAKMHEEYRDMSTGSDERTASSRPQEIRAISRSENHAEELNSKFGSPGVYS